MSGGHLRAVPSGGYERPSAKGAVDSDGGGPYDGDMEARVAKLEDAISGMNVRLARIDTRLEGVDKNMATTATVHKEIGDQTWKVIGWMTGVCTALVAAVYFIATHVKTP